MVYIIHCLFQRKHRHHLAKYIELTTSAKRKRGDSLGGAGRPSKQPKINAGATVTSCQVSQAKVDRLILGYLTEGLLPLSTVELPGFKDLIVGLQPNRTVLCRATVKRRFDEMVCAMKVNIRDTLRPLSFVATTTDCWSAHRRSYIGVTVHWIDPESLERKWAALACRRLRGSHTFDVLAAALEDINTEFGICQKICRTTTDSGSNFVKAFSVFGNKPDADTATDVDTCIESGIEFEDAGRVLETDEFVEYRLPSHHRCACHSLNLVSTTDAHHAEESPAYKRLSRAAFAKCQALWNKAGRSALAAEAVQDTCGLMLVKPNATRWNSVFLVVSRIVRIKREKGEEALHLMCNDLDLPR